MKHMHYFPILLFLGWVCHGDALINRIGEEQEQNKNDLKYRHIAYELVHSHLHVKDKDLNNVTVIKVTRQVVSGVVTKIQLQVFLVNGKSPKCLFRIWEKKLMDVKFVYYECDSVFTTAKIKLSDNLRPAIARNPKNPKYKKIAQLSLDAFFATPGHKPFKKEDVKLYFVSKVNVQINSKIITIFTFNVITLQNMHYICTSGVTEIPWLVEDSEKVTNVNCEIDGTSQNQPGGLVPQNRNDPKFKHLATESFKEYQETNGFIEFKHVQVTNVTTQVLGVDVITRIDFNVMPDTGKSFSCQSQITEQNGNNNKNVIVTCDRQNILTYPGGEVSQNPDDPKYKHLAKEAFKKFQQTKVTVKVKKIRIHKVTTQVVAGIVTRIDFSVVATNGKLFQCHSEVIEDKAVQQKNINVSCIVNKPIHGKEIPQNPDNPKYKQLATESFDNYLINNDFIDVKELKVIKVTTQVVSGTITRIDFNVITTNGQSIICYSEILEKISFRHKDFKVTCKKPENTAFPGGEVPQNPHDPKYKHLAKEAFKKFQEINGNIRFKYLIVNKVTTQIVAGIIIRIDFTVTPVKGPSFPCKSEVIRKEGLNHKNIKVTCEIQNHTPIPGKTEPQKPDKPKYTQIAKEEFENFQKSDGPITIKEIKISKVVVGVITTIDFIVNSIEGQSYSCHSEISHNKATITTCEKQDNPTIPGVEILQNPGDPKYKQLAKETFEKFQETDGTIVVNDLKVTKVTIEVNSGVITRIDFIVTPTDGQPFTCHSKINEQKQVKNKDVEVHCTNNKEQPSSNGKTPQNPDNPKYLQLAEESFSRYLNSHQQYNVRVQKFQVNKVTQEIVIGTTMLHIEFHVFPINNRQFPSVTIPCKSEIWEQENGKLDFSVNCDMNKLFLGSEEEQNPDDPKYYQLAKEVFREFQKSCFCPLYSVEEYKINRVTTQIVTGLLTRLDFKVNVKGGISFICNSQIIEETWSKRKDIVPKCRAITH